MALHDLNYKNFPHAILIREAKLCDLSYAIHDCKEKLSITSVDNYIEIDGYANTIKKEEVLQIIRCFQFSSYEGVAKLYVIYGIENASAQAINSLLKFLEEPPTNTYAILTTRNINGVLPTIRSRCQVFALSSDFNKLDELSKKFNLTKEQLDVIGKIYYNFDNLLFDLQNNIFIKNYDLSKTLIENYNNPQTIKEKSEQFKKMSYVEILMLLKIINCLVDSNIELLKLIDSIKLTPSRLMIFNRL